METSWSSFNNKFKYRIKLNIRKLDFEASIVFDVYAMDPIILVNKI